MSLGFYHSIPLIDVFMFNRSKVSELVTLNFDSKATSVLCHFGDFGCGDGGWTPVMKIDGRKVGNLSLSVVCSLWHLLVFGIFLCLKVLQHFVLYSN